MAKKVTMIRVKPNPEKEVNGNPIQVDHPFQTGRKINAGGESIQACDYLTRRIKDGDLINMDSEEPAKPKTGEAAHQKKEIVTPQSKKKGGHTPKKKALDSTNPDN